jgi:glycosylphosphatidylinositol deacylase
MSFSESMDVCLRTSLPFIFIALTFFAVSLSKASQGSWTRGWLSFLTGTSQKSVDFNVNDLMLGTQDPFLWFLVPLFGVISVGICIAGNYLITILMHVFAFIYGWTITLFGGQSDGWYVCSASTIFSHRETTANGRFSRITSFATTGGRQRLITTAILLLLITTLIPYQFAYMVLTIVQLCTCVRALRLARDTHSGAHYNFYNYATSMLVLMLWVLPINMPVLIVWIHNLAVHWLTPFSTHHNLLAVLPLVLLVEVMSAGNMTPRVTGRYVAILPVSYHSLGPIPRKNSPLTAANRARFVTNILTFLSALYAAIYGVTYAYRLHHLLNLLAAWLFAVHIGFQPGSAALSKLTGTEVTSPARLSIDEDAVGRDVKKIP